jgi:phosphoserine aminotransferase
MSVAGRRVKNLGVTGITIAIIKKRLLPSQIAATAPVLLHKLEIGGLPVAIVLHYATIVKNDSSFNSLPIFNPRIASQFMVNHGKTFGDGKVSGQEGLANKKAELIYKTLEWHPEVYQIAPKPNGYNSPCPWRR